MTSLSSFPNLIPERKFERGIWNCASSSSINLPLAAAVSWTSRIRRTPTKNFRRKSRPRSPNPKNKPVADYYEFLNLAVIANHFIFVKLDWKDKNGDPDTYRSRDYPALAKAARAFLEKYPKSKKREAAMLLYARAIYRASEDIALRKPVTWPQAARWEGGYEVTYSRQEPFDAKRVLGALDEYDRAFPKGRYAADIRAYRAAVAMRLHDWKTALTLTSAQLEDHADPSLDGETADRLGNIFTALTDERYRADILAAVKAAPAAKKLLQQYLAYQPEEYEPQSASAALHEGLAAGRTRTVKAFNVHVFVNQSWLQSIGSHRDSHPCRPPLRPRMASV